MSDERNILQKGADFNRLLELFGRFEEKHTALENEKMQLEVKLTAAKEQCRLQEDNEKSLNEELQNMETINANFQKILDEKCDVEEHSWKMRANISRLEKKMEENQKTHESEVENWKQILENQRQEDERAMKQEVHKLRKQMGEEISSLKSDLTQKDEEIRGLKERIKEQEKGKHSELAKLKIQYDAKIMKLQQENLKAHQQVNNTAGIGTNSSIYRQKLLNAKAATDREITSLKRTVSELQRKLEAQNAPKKRKL